MLEMKPNPGDLAPDFSLTADDGSGVSREGLLGKRYVLYFYPKDDTPGCTAQACNMRDEFERVTSRGLEVFGVSPDSVASHVKFKEKYELPYPLLSDEGHAAADAYGVWVEKQFRGRRYMGVERSSFIIGADGRVEHTLERVKPAEHVDLLLEAMGE